METFDTMQQVLATQPNLMNVIGDIFFKNSDLAGSEQLADQLPRRCFRRSCKDNDSPLPPQAQAAIAQAHQRTDAANASSPTPEAEHGEAGQGRPGSITARCSRFRRSLRPIWRSRIRSFCTQIAVAEEINDEGADHH